MSGCIAERELAYSILGSGERSRLLVRVFAPFEVQEGTVNFKVQRGTAGCRWEVDGLPEKIEDTAYGVDSLQALQLAIDLDGVLRSFRHKYDFYFPSGEPYFED